MKYLLLAMTITIITACEPDDPFIKEMRIKDPAFAECYEKEKKAEKLKEEAVKTINNDGTITYAFITKSSCELTVKNNEK